MIATLTAESPRAAVVPVSPRRERPLDAQMAAALELLKRSFGGPFTLLDCLTEQPLVLAEDAPHWDWGYRASLARAAAARGAAELIEEHGPCVTLAIPLPGDESGRLAAVRPFLTRQLADRELATLATLFGRSPESLASWAWQQTPQDCGALQRTADLVWQHMQTQLRLAQLQLEVESLSQQVGDAYDELNLVYGLIQNLSVTRDVVELAHTTLDALQRALPAQSLAVYLHDHSQVADVDGEVRTQPLTIWRGPSLLAEHQLAELPALLGLRANGRALLVNRPSFLPPQWTAAGVRQLVAVQLAHGSRNYGVLVAFNHQGQHDFGTVESNLLATIGTVLSIHNSNAESYREQAEMFSGVVRAMSSAIDAKDHYTRGHSDRVARIAVRLAQQLACSHDDVHAIYFAGLLHDVGKIGIDDAVLRKPGKLTEEEYEHIKTHTTIGYRILCDLKHMENVLPVVLHHHENWDGRGYPHGLSGEEIPYWARIVAVADAYDAMASDRPYRPGMPHEKIEQIFHDGAGRQWDPHVVAAFQAAQDDIRAIVERDNEHQRMAG